MFTANCYFPKLHEKWLCDAISAENVAVKPNTNRNKNTVPDGCRYDRKWDATDRSVDYILNCVNFACTNKIWCVRGDGEGNAIIVHGTHWQLGRWVSAGWTHSRSAVYFNTNAAIYEVAKMTFNADGADIAAVFVPPSNSPESPNVLLLHSQTDENTYMTSVKKRKKKNKRMKWKKEQPKLNIFYIQITNSALLIVCDRRKFK